MNVIFNTKNLEYYDVKKINEQIFVELKYTNIKEKIQKKLELDDIRFITHWKLTQSGNLGWITFFYLNEVFDICDSEKKYFKEKFEKEKKEREKLNEKTKQEVVNFEDIENINVNMQLNSNNTENFTFRIDDENENFNKLFKK